MAETVFNNILINKFDRIHTYDIGTEKLRAFLLEIQKWDIKFSEEETSITGANGRELDKIKKNKKIVVTASNATNCNELFELTQGADVTVSPTTPIRVPDVITVGTGATVLTSNTAVGTVGQEIKEIRVLDVGNTLGDRYEQAATADATHFAYDPSTKTITLPIDTGTPVITAGKKIVASYMFAAQGTKITISDNRFGLTQKVYLDVSGKDMCGNARHIQFIIPKASFAGETGVSGGGDQSIQDFTINALASGQCENSSEYFEYIVW